MRLFLALCVVSQHTKNPFGLPLLDAGTAVYLFFIISGFYMTMILTEKYVGHGANVTFYWNRVLRLWPAYAISIALVVVAGLKSGWIAAYWQMLSDLPWWTITLILISQATGIAQELFSTVSFTSSGISFAPSGIDPSHNGGRFLLNFPAWSIWVEMMFYFIAPFFVRSLLGSIALFAVGIAYWYFAPTLLPGHRTDIYFPFNCVFFGLGALSYWWWKAVTRKEFARAVLIVLTCNLVLATPKVSMILLYLLTSFAVPLLFSMTRKNTIDGFLGELSYPVYIMQLPVIATVYLFDHNAAPLVNVAAIVFVSAAIVLFVERPIDRIRQANARSTSSHLAREKISPRHAVL